MNILNLVAKGIAKKSNIKNPQHMIIKVFKNQETAAEIYIKGKTAEGEEVYKELSGTKDKGTEESFDLLDRYRKKVTKEVPDYTKVVFHMIFEKGKENFFSVVYKLNKETGEEFPALKIAL